MLVHQVCNAATHRPFLSNLGALATESEDLFYDCEDALDLVLGYCGGGGQELCFLRGDEEGGGGVFSFVGANEDGG